MMNSQDNKDLFSDLKKLIVEAFGTPRWMLELSRISDEVRSRSILVQINSQMHPINDLVIYQVFSEIGVVEDVVYTPVESGFHSRVQFRTRHSCDWAYHYYNGRYLHQGCCELVIHRPDDIINWNVQQVDKLKATYGIDNVSVMASDVNLSKVNLECADLLNQEEEASQLVPQNEPISAKEPSVFSAHQVLDKMPSRETGLHDEFLSDNVDLNHHTSDVGALVAVQSTLDEKLDCLRLSKVVDMSTKGICNDLIGAAHKLKVVAEHELQVAAEYEVKVVAEQDAIEVFKEEMTMVYKGIRSFDPGGLVVSNSIRSLIASTRESKSNGVSYKLSFVVYHLIQELVFVGVFIVAVVDKHKESKFVIIIFDPGGHLELSRSWLYVIGLLKENGHSRVFLLVLPLCSLHHFALKILNLEDKVLLNKGVL